ncbi:DUF2975 domain-containing protein [Gelidibacter mesophilus]|uniref:DUF2975 domain-containing protein n=1 Tax=Gelidibacter mesophilus TaxID=169050 RepID=UPI0003F9F463|nr:DUF2975 domain-containing protein [Gelidibacter mesophilus]
MTKNNLLNLAIVICKILQSFHIVALIVLTVLFVHIQIDGNFYSDKVITVENQNLTYNASMAMNSENKGQTLDQMSTVTLYLTYIKYAGILAFLFFSIREFQKIIKSVKNLATFQNMNFKSFRRIGQYVFIYFLLSSFYSYEFGFNSYIGFIPSLTPLTVTLVAFIMAEIFKEGNLLMEDKELTI